jgi:hypothetical protein
LLSTAIFSSLIAGMASTVGYAFTCSSNSSRRSSRGHAVQWLMLGQEEYMQELSMRCGDHSCRSVLNAWPGQADLPCNQMAAVHDRTSTSSITNNHSTGWCNLQRLLGTKWCAPLQAQAHSAKPVQQQHHSMLYSTVCTPHAACSRTAASPR